MTGRQLPLDLAFAPALGGEDFLAAPCNEAALAWLGRWPDWPAPALVLHGPAGCGKTHLARVFLARCGGREIAAAAAASPVEAFGDWPALLIEHADRWSDGEGERRLFHLYNTARDLGRHLLLTARRPPAQWGTELPDLRSRLLGAPAVGVGEPDDGLIAALLVKLFADRGVRVDDGVIPYLLARMERSFAAARRAVAEVDAAALAGGRRITVPLAREVVARWALREDGDPG